MNYEFKMKVLKEMIDNQKLIDNIAYLYERWDDEKEYEDWKEYDEQIKSIINYEYAKYAIRFLKATKKPFGFQFDFDGQAIQYFLKVNPKYFLPKIKLVKEK